MLYLSFLAILSLDFVSCSSLSGRFVIQMENGVPKTLGKGSFGEAYLAKDTQTNKDVVVKMLNIEGNNEQNRAELISEGQILGALDHPNIPKFIEFTKGSNPSNGLQQDWLVMEYINARSFGSIIDDIYARRRRPMKLDELALIGARLLKIVNYMHNKGIGHFDIHFNNVLLTEDLQPYLIDFGKAKSNVLGTTGAPGGINGGRSNAFSDPVTITADDIGMFVDYYGVALILRILYRLDVPYIVTPYDILRSKVKHPEFKELLEILLRPDRTQRWRECFEEYPQTFQKLKFFKHIDWKHGTVDMPELTVDISANKDYTYYPDFEIVMFWIQSTAIMSVCLGGIGFYYWRKRYAKKPDVPQVSV